MQRRVLFLPTMLLILLCLSGCVTGTGTGVVSGSLFFTVSPPPPPGDMITVEIYSFETPESPAIFLARAMVPSTGTSSVPFAIAYDKSKIVPKDIYIIQAFIRADDGHTTWLSGIWNPIITQGRATEEIQLPLRPNATP